VTFIQRLKNFLEDIKEVFSIIGTCFTIFWFWAPTLYMLVFILHLYLIFYVHPLTIFILPGALAIYSIHLDLKRKRKCIKKIEET